MFNPETIEKLMAAAKAVGYGEIPPYMHDECFTIGAFDLIILDSSDRGQNFRILEEICHKYEKIRNDPKFLSGYLYLLAQLARSTGTTELPAGMKKIFDEHPNTCLLYTSPSPRDS